jgi:hypothetical protein
MEAPKKSRIFDMSRDDAKKAGENFAAFLTSFRAEVLNAGLKEELVRGMLQDVVSAGDCSSGVMCIICT